MRKYDRAGFTIANHSFSHLSAKKIATTEYIDDIKKAHRAIRPFNNFIAYHRFPYLHYGKDFNHIKTLQDQLKTLGYKDGYVTIDNFDWYINGEYTKRKQTDDAVNINKLKQLYVDALWENIQFYDRIAIQHLGKSPKHIMLLHENDLSALFLEDLVKHIRKEGWKIISAEEAYRDPLISKFPETSFQKQGRIAAIAHSKGAPEESLRHPNENTEYLDKLFIEYQVFH